MSENLKPCPFCGGNAVFVDIHGSVDDDEDYPLNYAVCDDVKCMPLPLHFEVKQWNSRPIEDALRAELARVTSENTAQIVAGRRIINAAGDFTVVETDKLPRWIPVGERLPNNNGEYLVRSSYRDETFISTCEYRPIPSGAGWRTVSWVTHWMPLPAAPEVTE
jgi:hypothetical protein